MRPQPHPVRTVLFAILCFSLGSCRKGQPKVSMAHLYELEVEEVNPMIGVEKRWQVGPARGTAHSAPDSNAGYLNVYSNFYQVKQPAGYKPEFQQVPQDTITIALHQVQMDTIYQLARRTFALPVTPPLVQKGAVPPQPPTHDLDNYLKVSFQPRGWYGPTLSCSGYQEGNDAAYMLHYELTLLQKQHAAQPKRKIVKGVRS